MMTQAEKNEIIKEALKRLQTSKKKLLATWDAGGDETIVNITQEGINYYSHKYKDLDIYDELRDIISEELELPNTGETYDRGKGEIFLNNKNQIILKFDSQRYNTDYIYIERKLDDKYNLSQYLTENSIIFKVTKTDSKLYFYDEKKLKYYLPLEFLEATSYYENWARNIFNEYENKLQEQDERLISLELQGELNENQNVAFTIIKTYATVKPYNDEDEIILIA